MKKKIKKKKNADNKSLVTFCILTSSIAATTPVLASDYFNPSAMESLNGQPSTVDLSIFESKGGQAPGKYFVDIYINDKFIDKKEIEFIEINGNLKPKLPLKFLKDSGVKTDAFKKSEIIENDEVSDIADLIPRSTTFFDFSAQRLSITVPQAAMDFQANGYVDPSKWDEGIPAFLLNYNYSGSTTRSNSRTDETSYLNLRSGFNLGPWRLRNYSTYVNNKTNSKWDSIESYVQRDIKFLKGRLTVGDSTTAGQIFDSFQLRGIQLSSDDNMLPDSLKGFAPVVRGIANTNAQVTIKQNGYVIYQTYVPPGAFNITDLYPTSTSGNLDIEIKEADGRVRKFTQPFSSAPIMLRENQLKYSFSAGKYRSNTVSAQKPNFVQGTLIWGLPHDTTLYGGLLDSSNYNSGSVGIGHGFGDFGSISSDITFAKSDFNDRKSSNGQSYRLQYSKTFSETLTSLTIAGYRYSTSGFYDFQEFNELYTDNNYILRSGANKRSKTQLNITQSIGSYGSFYLSAYQQNYWKMSGFERSLSLGYNFQLAGASYNLSYTQSRFPGGYSNDQVFYFNVQVPMSKLLPDSWFNYSLSSNKNGETVNRIGLNGTALADRNLSYSLQQSETNKNRGSSTSSSITYKGSYGQLSGGYNHNNDSSQLNYGLQGGVVLHPYGVTFSQYLGDTSALVRAPGASNVKVLNNTGVYTDWRGYTVVPFVSSYKKNRIALDSSTLDDNVDLEMNATEVIPTKGAIVLATFKPHVGYRVLFTLKNKGEFIPFGSVVSVVGVDDASSSLVSNEGQVYLSGVPLKGKLLVRWGEKSNNECTVDYNIKTIEDGLNKDSFNCN